MQKQCHRKSYNYADDVMNWRELAFELARANVKRDQRIYFMG